MLRCLVTVLMMENFLLWHTHSTHDEPDLSCCSGRWSRMQPKIKAPKSMCVRLKLYPRLHKCVCKSEQEIVWICRILQDPLHIRKLQLSLGLSLQLTGNGRDLWVDGGDQGMKMRSRLVRSNVCMLQPSGFPGGLPIYHSNYHYSIWLHLHVAIHWSKTSILPFPVFKYVRLPTVRHDITADWSRKEEKTELK